MIDLRRTRDELLREIQASDGVRTVRLSDPADPRFTSLAEACLRVTGTAPAELLARLAPALSRRFADVPPERLFSDLLYLLKKGLGNAHKWGNQRDATRPIVVDAVVTACGAVVAISDAGAGFDPAGILGQMRDGRSYYTHGGSGFKHFQRATSVVSYANGGRTLLIRFSCAPHRPAGETGRVPPSSVAIPETPAPAPGTGGAEASMSKRRRSMKNGNAANGTAKVRVVSYPKGGRTWLRTLVGKALCESFGLDEDLIFGKFRGDEAPGVPRLSYTHDGCGFSKHRRYDELETDKSEYRKKKVLLLLRDPRDVLVSFYLHASRRSDLYHGSLSEFIRDDYYGIRKIVAFYNVWHANLRVPRDTLVLRYEHMHADPAGNLRATLDFIGMHDVTDGTVEKAVRFASFDNMKRLEGSRHFASKKLRPGKVEDEESWKVRRGVVGGHGAYLTPDDRRYIDDVMKEVGCAFYPVE
jgi:hypothetical protein